MSVLFPDEVRHSIGYRRNCFCRDSILFLLEKVSHPSLAYKSYNRFPSYPTITTGLANSTKFGDIEQSANLLDYLMSSMVSWWGFVGVPRICDYLGRFLNGRVMGREYCKAGFCYYV